MNCILRLWDAINRRCLFISIQCKISGAEITSSYPSRYWGWISWYTKAWDESPPHRCTWMMGSHCEACIPLALTGTLPVSSSKYCTLYKCKAGTTPKRRAPGAFENMGWFITTTYMRFSFIFLHFYIVEKTTSTSILSFFHYIVHILNVLENILFFNCFKSYAVSKHPMLLCMSHLNLDTVRPEGW